MTHHGNARPIRIAVPPYLKVRPLVEGLAEAPNVALAEAPPSRLHDILAGDRADVALLSTIDLQRDGPELCVIPAGCIAVAGGTLAVRIFTRVEPAEIYSLWVDEQARTATALAKVLWRENFGQDLRIVPFDAASRMPPADVDAALLVGDKVVSHPPVAYDRQVDLAAMWFEMTGLPFVFSIWAMARTCERCDGIYAILREAAELGVSRLESIARREASAAGWPEDLAVRCLVEDTQFDFTDACADGLEEFLGRADEIGLIDELRPLNFYPAES